MDMKLQRWSTSTYGKLHKKLRQQCAAMPTNSLSSGSCLSPTKTKKLRDMYFGQFVRTTRLHHACTQSRRENCGIGENGESQSMCAYKTVQACSSSSTCWSAQQAILASWWTNGISTMDPAKFASFVARAREVLCMSRWPWRGDSAIKVQPSAESFDLATKKME